MIHIEVEQDSLRYVQKRLGRNSAQAPFAICNAANQTATWARRELLAKAQERYTVKVGGFNKNTTIKRASPSTLTAIIRVKGRTLKLNRFRSTAPKKGAAKAAVLAGSGLQELLYGGSIKAFKSKVTTGKTKSNAIMQRRGGSRLPVKVLHGPSVPKMVEMVYTGKSEAGLKVKIEAMYQAKLNEQIRRVLYS